MASLQLMQGLINMNVTQQSNSKNFFQLQIIGDLAYRNIFELKYLSSLFLIICSIAHFLTVINSINYFKELEKQSNKYRWIEYSVTSTLMLIFMGQYLQLYNLFQILTIIFLNVMIMFCGHKMEAENKNLTKISWKYELVGCLLFVFILIIFVVQIIKTYNMQESSKQIISTLIIFIVMILTFIMFPINQVLYLFQLGLWKNINHEDKQLGGYIFTEKIYVALSFISKSLLLWNIRLFQENVTTEVIS